MGAFDNEIKSWEQHLADAKAQLAKYRMLKRNAKNATEKRHADYNITRYISIVGHHQNELAQAKRNASEMKKKARQRSQEKAAAKRESERKAARQEREREKHFRNQIETQRRAKTSTYNPGSSKGCLSGILSFIGKLFMWIIIIALVITVGPTIWNSIVNKDRVSDNDDNIETTVTRTIEDVTSSDKPIKITDGNKESVQQIINPNVQRTDVIDNSSNPYEEGDEIDENIMDDSDIVSIDIKELESIIELDNDSLTSKDRRTQKREAKKENRQNRKDSRREKRQSSQELDTDNSTDSE